MRRGKKMKIKVENFAKIKEADIEINGITVIGGENNTGKSTIGKILYSLFTIFHDFDKKVLDEKITSIFRTIFRETGSDFEYDNFKKIFNIASHLTQLDEVSEESVQLEINKYIKDKISSAGLKNILNYLSFKTGYLEELVAMKVFNNEFNGQFLPIYDTQLSSNLELHIKNEKLQLSINRKGIKIKDRLTLYNDGIYIDNPFIIDEIKKGEDIDRFFDRLFNKIEYDHISSLKTKLGKSLFESNTSLIDNALLKQRTEQFIDLLRTTVNGDFIEKDNKFTFSENTYGADLELSNLSTGIKSFAIILKLLENNDLKDKSLIILDEPEVHLHPKWQLKYAEILVLLQKEFDLNILLTTHSPYFINALEEYSKKYEIKNKMKYYLAELDNNLGVFKDVTENTEEIYSLLAEPFEKLASLEE